MSLYIRKPETEKLARELASRTGESLTDAVHKSLEERLARVPCGNGSDKEARVAQLLKIAEGATGLRALNKTSLELLDELYDESGLPA